MHYHPDTSSIQLSRWTGTNYVCICIIGRHGCQPVRWAAPGQRQWRHLTFSLRKSVCLQESNVRPFVAHSKSTRRVQADELHNMSAPCVATWASQEAYRSGSTGNILFVMHCISSQEGTMHRKKRGHGGHIGHVVVIWRGSDVEVMWR